MFWSSESKTELRVSLSHTISPKPALTIITVDVHTGLMNLVRKCVQIKYALGQLYTYLFKNY
jgi:hypothetical protein